MKEIEIKVEKAKKRIKELEERKKKLKAKK